MPKALTSPSATALYDRDFLLWIEATCRFLGAVTTIVAINFLNVLVSCDRLTNRLRSHQDSLETLWKYILDNKSRIT